MSAYAHWVHRHEALFPPTVKVITHPDYGGRCDARTVGDVVTTSGESTVTSATAAFTRGDVGKVASLRVGATGLTTTVASVASPTKARLVDPVPASGSAGILTWGTDDTQAVEAAYADVPAAGTLLIPGQALVTAPLAVRKSLTLAGTGHGKVMGSVVDSGYGSGSSTPPYIEGSCLVPVTAGQNAVELVGTGNVVHIRDLGIRFAPAVMFIDTGHGIFCQSEQMFNTGHDNGPMNCRWDTVTIWGHDGDHYAVWGMNGPHLSTITHVQGQGGGGLYLASDGDSTAGYGNSHWEHCFFEVIAGGTAHGVHLDGRQIVNNASYGSSLNLFTFMRPQVNIAVVSYPKLNNLGIPAPTAAQYLWRNTGTPAGYEPKSVDLLAPDLEPGASNPVTFGGIHKGTTVRRTGTMVAPDGGVSTEDRANPIYGGSLTNKPNITLLTAAGTGATTQWVDGHQLAGVLQIVLGSDTTAGDIATITCPALPDTGIDAVFAQVLLPWGQANKHVFARIGADAKSYILRAVEGFTAGATIQLWIEVFPAYAFMGEDL